MNQQIFRARTTAMLAEKQLGEALNCQKVRDALSNPGIAQLWKWAAVALEQSKQLRDANTTRALWQSKRDILFEVVKFAEQLGPEATEEEINAGISGLAESVLRNCGPRATNKN